MDLYISSLLLGALGLAAMALSGLGHQGHAGHGHAGHHGGHIGHGAHGRGGHEGHASAQSFWWSIASPRFLFSVALGFGAVGELVRPVFGGPLQLAAAIAGGVLFEWALMRPLWNFVMRFASTPALTLESAVADEATAVTAFDANGRGIVSLELDGQIVQILATLKSVDRDLGVRVRAGQRVRIDDVNPATNQCVVSLL